jgi:hypothetical protein
MGENGTIDADKANKRIIDVPCTNVLPMQINLPSTISYRYYQEHCQGIHIHITPHALVTYNSYKHVFHLGVAHLACHKAP